MYLLDKDWNFAFGLREGHYAVVSSARMDVDDPGGAPGDSALLHKRLVKMVSRDIGFLYYGLSPSPNPHSVVRESLMGTDELDEMGEDF
jgi:predicted Zn-dependent protease